MAAVTGPSPTKAELEKRGRESMGTIEGLTSANATLTVESVFMAEELEAEVNLWENSLPFFSLSFFHFRNSCAQRHRQQAQPRHEDQPQVSKMKKNAEVAAELAVLRAELNITVTCGRRIGELEAEVAALEAERDEPWAEVDKSNDMARGKTREVMALRMDLHATENKLAEMEEQLQEVQGELTCSANKTAFRKARDADAD
jgi:hypothetical protein